MSSDIKCERTSPPPSFTRPPLPIPPPWTVSAVVSVSYDTSVGFLGGKAPRLMYEASHLCGQSGHFGLHKLSEGQWMCS